MEQVHYLYEKEYRRGYDDYCSGFGYANYYMTQEQRWAYNCGFDDAKEKKGA